MEWINCGHQMMYKCYNDYLLVFLQSLGCTLYAMAFLESPFEKAYQRGDSIALAVMSQNITFPQNR